MTLYRGTRRLAGRAVRAIPWLRRQFNASSDYKLITRDDAYGAQAEGWSSFRTVRRQERAYDSLLRDMRNGAPRIDLKVAAEAVDAIGLGSASLLEVGCGSGYYSEVFEYLSETNIAYTGIDYSPAMIARAKARYPKRTFALGDGTALATGDATFDIVFNGVSLMHIMEYDKAIAETVRTARVACIFHSVPIFADHPTVYVHKYAYGSPVVEIVFSRDDLLASFARHDLEVVRSWNSISYDIGIVGNASSHAETFLCVRRGSA